MDDIFILLSKWLKSLKVLFSTLYYKTTFIFNKQKTVYKMMKPLLEDKQRKNKLLLMELHRLKEKNSAIDKEIQLFIKENKLLKNRILLIQSLLVKNNS